MRTYGNISFSARGQFWTIKAEPQVMGMFKRVFVALGRQFGELHISHSLQSAETIEWILIRYPLECTPNDAATLAEAAAESRKLRIDCVAILNTTNMEAVETRLPLRDYQLRAVHLLKKRGSLLVGDDLGLGKTAIALGAVATGLKSIIVCMTHLQQQWVNEAMKFLPRVFPHVCKQGKPYKMPGHNMLVIPYSKLSKWADTLDGYDLIVFDEAQEVRRDGTAKYEAAKHLCGKMKYRLGLTATPVYNYGDEIFNIVDLLDHGSLGSRTEFLTEWCRPMGSHHAVNDPNALGAHLAENHVFLRRRRKEVGRELPAVTKIIEEVSYDSDALIKNEERAFELAKLVLHGEWEERGRAALMLDALLRLQTGIAKAPFVADFIRQLVEAGEYPILVGWHREVYDIWQRILAQHSIKSVLYTGTESPKEKDENVQKFLNGEADVFMGSLRSGSGLNGLQNRSSCIVIGEFDWSPQVIEQWIGRLNRDGQDTPVTAVYLFAAGGSDPVMASVLGIKREQSEGIINPGAEPSVMGQQAAPHASQLARKIISEYRRPPTRVD